MFGILLIYWVGKFFYQLAIQFNKSKWGFAVLGLATYYGSQIIFGFILAMFNEIFTLGVDFDSVGINLLGIPIGAGACYLLYKFLEKKWKREYVNPLIEIETIGVSNE